MGATQIKHLRYDLVILEFAVLKNVVTYSSMNATKLTVDRVFLKTNNVMCLFVKFRHLYGTKTTTFQVVEHSPGFIKATDSWVEYKHVTHNNRN